MKLKKRYIIYMFLMLLMVIWFTPREWRRSMITVWVVDAETQQPIDHASVFITWTELKGPPGLTHDIDIETFRTRTDNKGRCGIPKYWFTRYTMTAYKPGYVCWSSDDIFPGYKKRTDFWLRSGVAIKLERFKDEYSRIDHIHFIEGVSISQRSLLDEALGIEKRMIPNQKRGK